MAAVNTRRVALGALAGGVVWSIWSTVVNVVILKGRYGIAQDAGLMLKQPRYHGFPVYWFITIFLLAYVVAWLYSSVRATRGAGPGTALSVGLLVGFAAGFPMNLSAAAWSPVGRHLPLWWMLDLWLGAIVASLVAGWIYKD
ncbi:MAG: hypothetical protein WBO19_19575 [Terriglobia bacterium]|jgi:hypothetical protein